MAATIPLTVGANLTLIVMLLFNNYYSRFAALTVTAVYSVLADPILQQINLHAHAIYMHWLAASEFIVIVLMLFIITESWQAGEFRVRRLVEIQLVGEVMHILVRAEGFRHVSYYINCSLLIYSLVTIIYFAWIFRRPSHES